jgi:hypothetical protein
LSDAVWSPGESKRVGRIDLTDLQAGYRIVTLDWPARLDAFNDEMHAPCAPGATRTRAAGRCR